MLDGWRIIDGQQFQIWEAAQTIREVDAARQVLQP
jgi:hypothetical protein